MSADLQIRHSENTGHTPRSGNVIITTTGEGTAVTKILTFTQMAVPLTPLGTPSGETVKASSPINLFPNPSNGDVFLFVETEQKQEVQVSFFDALGNLAYRQDFEVTPNSNRIAFSPTVDGGGALYFVHIKGENLDEVRRLIMR